MGLEPKTTEELEQLVAHLRRIGVQHYSAHGVSLVLCDPQPTFEKVVENEAARSEVLGLTEEEQVDLFNTVAEAVPKERTR